MVDSAPVRAACLLAAAAHPDGSDVTALPTLIASLDDEDRMVRDASARALAARVGVEDALLTVLRTGSPRAQEAALTGLAGHATTAREGLLDWARDQIERVEDLHASRAALDGTSGATPLQGFLAQVVDQRIRRAEASGDRCTGHGRRARRWGPPAPIPAIGRSGGSGAGDRSVRFARRPPARARPHSLSRGIHGRTGR